MLLSSECTKTQFDKVGAQTALNKLLKRGTFKEGFGRIYHCGFCGFWHLTSQPKYEHLADCPQEEIMEDYHSLQHEKEWLELLNNSDMNNTIEAELAESWKNHEPAPIEFFHGKIMDAFHELRRSKGDNAEHSITMNGLEMNNLIARIKTETYKKYPNHVSNQAIPKTEL